MNTLIVYDNEGKIFSQVTGAYMLPQGGIQFLEFKVPEGKFVESVDISKEVHEPVLVSYRPSDTENLQQQIAELQYHLMMNGVL